MSTPGMSMSENLENTLVGLGDELKAVGISYQSSNPIVPAPGSTGQMLMPVYVALLKDKKITDPAQRLENIKNGFQHLIDAGIITDPNFLNQPYDVLKDYALNLIKNSESATYGLTGGLIKKVYNAIKSDPGATIGLLKLLESIEPSIKNDDTTKSIEKLLEEPAKINLEEAVKMEVDEARKKHGKYSYWKDLKLEKWLGDLYNKFSKSEIGKEYLNKKYAIMAGKKKADEINNILKSKSGYIAGLGDTIYQKVRSDPVKAYGTFVNLTGNLTGYLIKYKKEAEKQELAQTVTQNIMAQNMAREYA